VERRRSANVYVEFKQGQKYAEKGADVSDTHEGFRDAGYVLEDNDLVIDIDCLDKETVQKLITMFNIKTQIVWTDRGAHLYFKKPSSFTRGSNRVCALGFPIELKHIKNTQAVTIKRNGKMRDIEHQGVREDLPNIFSINKKFSNLLGLDDGEGRNNSLFRHRAQLAGARGWENMLRFINNFIFATPLSEEEYQAIVRDMNIQAEKDNEPLIAEWMMNQYKMVRYSDRIYYYHEGEYKSDENILRRLIFGKVGNQKTRYVDEVIKQIEYRCQMVDDSKGFDIKFKNGILRRGKFIEVDYDDFTPYSIDINYYPDADPVEDVDKYIDHLTQGDPDYKRLLFEILGHTLIVDREFKRLLAKFFIFVGSGGNGKGTLLQIIKQILNPKNCTGLSIKNMSDERYFVTMKGKLANLGDDIQDEPIDNEQMKQLKNISTCDYIAARELYKQSSSIQLTISLIFTSNHVLKSFEKGKSYKRRVMWLPMFTEVDDNNKDAAFITKLTTTEALEYWISQIVAGYFRLYENARFSECGIVSDYNEEYHKDNNTVLMWLDDLTADDLLMKKSPEVYTEYETWANENGLNVGSAKMMREAIREKFKLELKPKKINGKTYRVFVSLG
jgi:putative DNA primase/helicase